MSILYILRVVKSTNMYAYRAAMLKHYVHTEKYFVEIYVYIESR